MTYFKASQEFLTATQNQSLNDRNQSVKKVLDDDKVMKLYEKSIKQDKNQEMVNRGLVDKLTKVRRIVPMVKLTSIKNFTANNESVTTFNAQQSIQMPGFSTRDPTPRREAYDKGNLLFSSRHSPIQQSID